MAPDGYQEIEHTADRAIRVGAETLTQLFELAAEGMYSIAGIQVSSEDESKATVRLEANDLESLLVLWLEELLYLVESQQRGVANLKVQRVGKTQLEAEITAAPISAISRDIKAVTFHNLEIIQQGDRWSVEIVFDV